MTDTNNVEKQYIKLTAGPIPINEAMFYVYPGDWYRWIPSGGDQVVLYRVFDYDTDMQEVAVGFYATPPGGQEKITKKTDPALDLITNGYYFKVQANDYIRIDFLNTFKVFNKNVVFDELADEATVELLVEAVEDQNKTRVSFCLPSQDRRVTD